MVCWPARSPTTALFPYTTLFRSYAPREPPALRGDRGVPVTRMDEDDRAPAGLEAQDRSEEHTSELQSPDHIVCRLLLEKKNFTSVAGPVSAAVCPLLTVTHLIRR